MELRKPFVPFPAHGLKSLRPASTSSFTNSPQPVCVHTPSMRSHPCAAMISAIFWRAVAEFHMLGVSAMILMSGMLGKDGLCSRVATRVDHGAGYAAHEDDVALAVQLLRQPFGGTGPRPFLVDTDVIGAGLRHLGVPGDEGYALSGRRRGPPD